MCKKNSFWKSSEIPGQTENSVWSGSPRMSKSINYNFTDRIVFWQHLVYKNFFKNSVLPSCAPKKHPQLAPLLQIRNSIFDHKIGKYRGQELADVQKAPPVDQRLNTSSSPLPPTLLSLSEKSSNLCQHISFSVIKPASAGLHKVGTPIANQAK